jgi:hypothetical protein
MITLGLSVGLADTPDTKGQLSLADIGPGQNAQAQEFGQENTSDLIISVLERCIE